MYIYQYIQAYTAHVYMCKQGVLGYTCFGLHSFSYTLLRKIINIQKIVRFSMGNSVMRDFRARSSENCSIYD